MAGRGSGGMREGSEGCGLLRPGCRHAQAAAHRGRSGRHHGLLLAA